MGVMLVVWATLFFTVDSDNCGCFGDVELSRTSHGVILVIFAVAWMVHSHGKTLSHRIREDLRATSP